MIMNELKNDNKICFIIKMRVIMYMCIMSKKDEKNILNKNNEFQNRRFKEFRKTN